jgi:FKBP-type peptidyl-prolyl cis-trans isomerase FkpA
MRITMLWFGLLMLLCVACNKSEKETPSGLKFKVVKAGDGVLPRPGEILVFNYLFKDSKDSVWTDTFAEEFPQAMPIGDSMAIATESGLIQLLRMLSKGDSITTQMSINEFFKDVVRNPVPPGFDTTLTFYFRFKANDIMSREAFMAYQNEWMEKRNKEQLQKDIAEIDAYLAANNIQALTSETGLRYVISKSGKGENGQPGQTAKVNYTGYLLDGQYFDSNVKDIAQEKGLYNPMREPYAPYDVVIDQTSVIRGWHEALKLMNAGAKATFYIPSTLAYGPQQRSEVIKANAILVFDMEVVELK